MYPSLATSISEAHTCVGVLPVQRQRDSCKDPGVEGHMPGLGMGLVVGLSGRVHQKFYFGNSIHCLSR